PCALLLGPVDPFLLGVDIDERQHVLTGQQRGAAGQLRPHQPVHLPELQHVPPGERPPARPQPGRRPHPPNSAPHPPARTRPRPSMLPAPPTTPATTPGSSPAAFTPHGRAIRTCSPASAARPASWASAITGTRPARDTRFGSSNVAWILVRSCNNRTCEVSSQFGIWKYQQLPSSQFRGHLSRRHAPIDPYLRG